MTTSQMENGSLECLPSSDLLAGGVLRTILGERLFSKRSMSWLTN